MEFQLPAQLGQAWLERPETNAGLLIRAGKPQEQWGEHVYFYSSENPMGRGPELIVEGEPGAARGAEANKRIKEHPALPADKTLDMWLAAGKRLARFTKDCQMSREQARVFCYLDTTVRERLVLGRYQLPLARLITQMEPLIAKGDEAALREKLREYRKYLLVWEYIRETNWYTMGPLADVLGPRQLAILFASSIFGRMESAAREQGKTIWQPLAGDKLAEDVRQTMEATGKKLGLGPEAMKAMEPVIAECERQEQAYLAKFREALGRSRELAAEGADGGEMFRCVKRLHLNHELFLYYQSIYDTPRWAMFMEQAPIIAFSKWVAEGRKEHYSSRVKNARQSGEAPEQ